MTTGLPDVPAGYYWEIKGPDSESLTTNWLRIELRQKTPFYLRIMTLVFSVHIVSTTVCAPYTDQRIREAAQEVLDSWKEAEQIRDSGSRYVGKYPPKKLGA